MDKNNHAFSTYDTRQAFRQWQVQKLDLLYIVYIITIMNSEKIEKNIPTLWCYHTMFHPGNKKSRSGQYLQSSPTAQWCSNNYSWLGSCVQNVLSTQMR